MAEAANEPAEPTSIWKFIILFFKTASFFSFPILQVYLFKTSFLALKIFYNCFTIRDLAENVLFGKANYSIFLNVFVVCWRPFRGEKILWCCFELDNTAYKPFKYYFGEKNPYLFWSLFNFCIIFVRKNYI